jgi:ADP-ribose pyrophosphatase
VSIFDYNEVTASVREGFPPRRIIYTHPDVLCKGVAEGWADPETDPTRINWTERQARAAIPFEVVSGRPVNPCEKTAIRYGRNELGHWGEGLAADALVSATDAAGRRRIVMIERTDAHGWAIPGGHVEAGETPIGAAWRELREEAGLNIPSAWWTSGQPRYVPDPRASDEAWMVTVLCTAPLDEAIGAAVESLPILIASDDAARADWVPADTYEMVTGYLARTYGGKVFPAHAEMLQEALT